MKCPAAHVKANGPYSHKPTNADCWRNILLVRGWQRKLRTLSMLMFLSFLLSGLAAMGQSSCPTSPAFTPDFSSNQSCMALNGIEVNTPSTLYPGFYPAVPPPPPGVTTVLRLTPNQTDWAGSGWFNTAQPVSGGFVTTFQFQLSGGNTDLSPADGFAFLIQNSAATTNLPSTSALGPEACGIGFGWSNWCLPTSGPQTGIPNSLAIEFNTFLNTNVDQSSNDVTIQNCLGTGANSVDPTCTVAVNNNLPITLADGNVHSVTITYSGTGTTLLDVIVDGYDLFPATANKQYDGVLFDLTTIGLTNGNAWVGFTAGTGGGDDNQDILSWTFAPSQQGQQITSTSGLTQNFVSDNTPGQHVELDFDYSTSNNNGDLTIQSDTIPFVTPGAISPFDWATIVNGTAMADAPCLIANGQNVCVVNTITCTNANDSNQQGSNCPQSSVKNILLQQEIDLAQNQAGIMNGILTIPPGYAPGMAEGPDVLVSGAECNFPSGEPLANQLCPLSFLTQLEDPTVRIGGAGTTTNSTFVFFCCEPEWQTTPNIPFWTNSTSVPAKFTSVPPATPVPDTNNFHAAQGQSVVVGAEPHGVILDTTYPLPAEQTLNNPVPCPALGTPPATPWSTQNPQPFSINNGVITTYDNNGTVTPLTEGAYDAHYFSVDCDSFEELVFPPTLNVQPGTPGPNVVNFKVVPFNIDLTPPQVSSITLSPSGGYYAQNSTATATVSCFDPASTNSNAPPNFFSGVAACGAQGSPQAFAGNPQSVTTAPIALNTSALGTQTFTAVATDVAGNTTTASTTYQVVGTADIAVGILGNLAVVTGTNMTYYMFVANIGPNTAQNVNLVNTLPAGTTFVSSGYAIDSCTITNGQPQCSINPPKTSCGSVAGSCSIGSLSAWTSKNPTGALVVMTVNVNAKAGAILNDTVSVTETNTDPNLKNNTQKWATLVLK